MEIMTLLLGWFSQETKLVFPGSQNHLAQPGRERWWWQMTSSYQVIKALFAVPPAPKSAKGLEFSGCFLGHCQETLQIICPRTLVKLHGRVGNMWNSEGTVSLKFRADVFEGKFIWHFGFRGGGLDCTADFHALKISQLGVLTHVVVSNRHPCYCVAAPWWIRSSFHMNYRILLIY